MRRPGKAGYLALGPDRLSSIGSYPGNDEKGREMRASLDPVKPMEDFFAGFEFLQGHPDCTGRMRFCYCGVCNALSVTYPDMAASVPFYGRQPRAQKVARIRAPLLIHYAETDERVNSRLARL